MHSVSSDGIEDAQLDIGMRTDPGEATVAPGLPVIIQQHAHVYASISGGEEVVEQEITDQVVFEHEVLKVDALLGRINENRAGDERIGPAAGEQVNARLTRMRLGLCPEPAAEFRLLG